MPRMYSKKGIHVKMSTAFQVLKTSSNFICWKTNWTCYI